MERAMNKANIYYSIKELIEKDCGEDTIVEITNMKLNKDGFSNDIAVLDIKYCTNNVEISKEVVFKDYSKTYKGNDGITKYKKEVAILNNNNRLISVPKIFFADEEKKIVLMEKINGVTLDKLYLNDPKRFNSAIKKFGETFAYIHSLDDSLKGEYTQNNYANPKEYFMNYVNLLRSRVISYGEEEYLKVLDSLCERFNGVDFDKGCLNHGDYHFCNVIFTQDDNLYVLDWEKAKIADYRYDIANTLILCYSWFGIEFKKLMLEAYMNVTGRNIPNLDCFEALLSFDSFTKCIPLIQGGDEAQFRDKTFVWVKRRYELFAEKNDKRVKKAEEYLKSKGLL